MKPIFQDIVMIDREAMTVTVRNRRGQKYIVKPTPEMEYQIKHRGVLIGDFAKVVKSAVSKEWFMVDFKINTAMYDYDNYGDDTSVTNDVEPDYTGTLEGF